MSERQYLSIGEVLGLLLEEFPDITISKIRFLESQGLIDPERTPSGYRKFYDGDVDRLRVILREQRENFLPLKVIRERMENGQIESEGTGTTPPRGIRNVTVLPVGDDSRELSIPSRHHPSAQLRLAQVPGAATRGQASAPEHSDPGPLPSSSVLVPALAPQAPPAVDAQPSSSPATLATAPAASPAESIAAPEPASVEPAQPSPPPPALDHRDTYSAAELLASAGITEAQLAEIESYGLVTARGTGRTAHYVVSDLAIAKAAAGFLGRGVEARHLRAWRQAADREASLFEQLILPMLRQRNPQSRQQAVVTLTELSELGAELRSAFLYSALRHHLEGGPAL